MDDPARDALLAHDDPEVASRLAAIQAEVTRRISAAVPCIGYKMPAFRVRRVFFYFAAFKGHIGVYPPVRGPADLLEKLAPYRGPKGNLSFPHKDELPIALIGEVAEQLARDYAD